jgi:hypothetical protein
MACTVGVCADVGKKREAVMFLSNYELAEHSFAVAPVLRSLYLRPIDRRAADTPDEIKVRLTSRNLLRTAPANLTETSEDSTHSRVIPTAFRLDIRFANLQKMRLEHESEAAIAGTQS